MRDSALPLYVGLFALVGWSVVGAESGRHARCDFVGSETAAHHSDDRIGAGGETSSDVMGDAHVNATATARATVADLRLPWQAQ